MKHNYRRNYVDQGSFRDRGCQTIAFSKITGKYAYIGNDYTNGHRGHAKAVRGAKKFIRTRDRAFNKSAAKLELLEDV